MLIANDVSEYTRDRFPPLLFYIGGRLLPKKGRMEICGAPGVMKSFLAQYTGYCIASGTEWLGFPTHQARTLICNFEMSPEVSNERIVEMSEVFPLPPMSLYELNIGTLFLDHDRNLNSLIEVIDNLQVKVVILDYFRLCFSGKENDSQDIMAFTHNLDILIREHDVSIILLHHTNKNPLYTGGMDKSSGHHALPGWMDSVLYLAKQPNGVQLQFSKMRHSRVGELAPLNLIFENNLWRRRQ